MVGKTVRILFYKVTDGFLIFNNAIFCGVEVFVCEFHLPHIPLLYCILDWMSVANQTNLSDLPHSSYSCVFQGVFLWQVNCRKG